MGEKDKERISTSSSNSNREELDTSRLEKVWLMKCPPLVSRSWLPEPQPTDSEVDPPPPRHLAKVTISIDPSDDTSPPEFTMELASNHSENAPKVYSLDMSKDFVPMCVFSQTNQGKVAVEGTVLNKFDMKPHEENIGDYGKLCRERTNKYMVKSRQVKVIENDRGEHMLPKPAMITSTVSVTKDKNKPMPTKASDSRRSRRDRGEMEAIMFKLFERQPNWTLRQLIQETDQPEQFLKDILKELCVYNNRGTNQGSYELKPEYKQGSIKEESPS